jgi:hypothetical protein
LEVVTDLRKGRPREIEGDGIETVRAREREKGTRRSRAEANRLARWPPPLSQVIDADADPSPPLLLPSIDLLFLISCLL